MSSSDTSQTPPAASADPVELLRSRSYLVLLVLGGIVGTGVAVVAYFFLKAVSEAQTYVFTTLPEELGFAHEPLWWPLPWLALAGVLVALTIRYLPGNAGHKPAEGFKTGGPVPPIELPGIVLASLATLCFGAVLGPEAPLIAIGSGLGVLAVHLLKKDAPTTAVAVIGAAGSFAAISTLLGSPLVGAFLLMEAAGLGGPMLGVVLVPGLLAAGIGALIFVGLDAWTGFGTFTLAVPGIPTFGSPTGPEFLWAVAIGVAAALLGAAIRRLGLFLQPVVERRAVSLTPVVGLGVAGLAMIFAAATTSQAKRTEQDDAMNISAPFINRPVATTLLMVAVAFAGAVAFPLLPVAPLPKVDFPTINVSASLPGASSGDHGVGGGAAARAPVLTDRGRHADDFDQHARRHIHRASVRAQPRHRFGGAGRAIGDCCRKPATADGYAVTADLPEGEPSRLADSGDGGSFRYAPAHGGRRLRRHDPRPTDIADRRRGAGLDRR